MNPDIGTTESSMISGGYPHLSGDELMQKISGNTILGDFGYLFKFIMTVGSEGALEGKNNAGAHHFGRWSIDASENTMTVEWESGWINNTSRAYEVDGKVKLFNIETGEWMTTFTDIIVGVQNPLIQPE